VKIQIEDKVISFIRELPEKDRRVIGEHIERLTNHPNATGNIKKLNTRKPRLRMHISLKYTVFFYVIADTVCIDLIMTIERAHKKYGKI
jgi:mRNA-degrading endonuclease RelE of RelBE toxin-antitoxin system